MRGVWADVDRVGVRVGVKRGSAYDLYLTRTLEHADLVRGEDGVDVYLDQALPVGAGFANRWSSSLHDTRAIASSRSGSCKSSRPSPFDALFWNNTSADTDTEISGWAGARHVVQLVALTN